jgi:hypothetical protein
MKKLFSVLTIAMISLAAFGQARVQVIHNCADAAAASVDIYVNGGLLYGNLAFRECSPFEDQPAGIPLTIAVSPAGAGLAAAVATFPGVVLDNGEKYIVVANGIVSPSGYDPAPQFDLDIYPGAREAASSPGNTDVLVVHGSTDAPTVDVLETLVLNTTAVDDISYGDFQGYLSLPTNNYRLAIATSDQSATLLSYEAPLQSLGLTGASVTVLASGFLNPDQNNNGPSFGLWAATVNGGALIPLPLTPPSSTARLKVIHNAADLAAASVDIFANGEPVIEGLDFRHSTPFITVDAGVSYDLAVAPAGAGLGAAVATIPGVVFQENETYIAVANGIVSGSGYSPATPFSLNVYQGAREEATDPSKVDVLVLHGSTDAPVVDVVEDNLDLTLIDNFAYGQFAGYLELELANYVLNVTSEDGSTPYFSYSAPLAALSLQGQAITVLASGFLNPGQNSNGPSFGLWVAPADGGALIELPAATARVQIIHNSADPAAALVDIYASGLFTDVIAVDDLGFRQATPFVTVPANVNLSVEIAGSDSDGPGNGIVSFDVSFEDGETYVVTASGVVLPGFDPQTPFTLEVFAGARENGISASDVDVLVLHGATDAPAVDVLALGSATPLISSLEYAEYAGYLSLPEADYVLELAAAGSDPFIRYAAPLETLGLGGNAVTVVASGFLNPAANASGPEFGLWVALAGGGDLVPLPAYVIAEPARVQVIHNAADAAAEVVDVYVESPFSAPIFLDDFAFRTASPFVDVISETEVTISVAPSDSESSDDAIATFNVTVDAGETYVVIANGIVSESGYSPAPEFGLDIFAGAREAGVSEESTDLLIYHGVTDAPVVDVVETGLGAGTVVDNIAYGEFQGYLSLPVENYEVAITAESGSPTVATYGAPLQSLSLGGAALTVLASGFLDPGANSNGPAFGLWVALPSGGPLVELPLVSGIAEDRFVSGLSVYPNPAESRLTVAGSTRSSGQLAMEIADAAGRIVMRNALNTSGGKVFDSLDVSVLNAGIYSLTLSNGQMRETVRFTVVR